MVEQDEKAQEKSFDHRKFGLEKKFFSFPRGGGVGFPFWLPNGYKLLEIVREHVNKFQREICGIKLVKTPVLGKKELYCKTGHLPLYKENIFEEVREDGEEYILRPMTCPHHILLAKELIQGYRQLPYLIGENAILHRHEYSGGLLGLKRVRTMELIDTHIFLLEEQSQSMIEVALSWIWILLSSFGVKIKEIVLATRSDKEKYLLSSERWESAENILFKSAQEWAKKNKVENLLVIKSGEAAFYGPKIDFNAEDVSNQSFTISTIQLDTLMCSKLDFFVLDAQQNQVSLWIIHVGLIGTLERFIAYLLEKWEGNIPFWLSPIQVIVIPVEENKFQSESLLLVKKINSYGFRAELDNSKEKLSKKLFIASQNRINIQVLVGAKEIKNPSIISFRQLGFPKAQELSFDEFIGFLNKLNSESKNS